MNDFFYISQSIDRLIDRFIHDLTGQLSYWLTDWLTLWTDFFQLKETNIESARVSHYFEKAYQIFKTKGLLEIFLEISVQRKECR